MSNQSPHRWVFATPFCVCRCHIWVKLCAEQLCGFCTSRSPIGCGKLPLQLVISLFDMPPLYLYIIIPFTRIESKIAQWQNQSAKLATRKHITHLAMQKTHMHGAKESHLFYTWNQTVNAHSQVRKSLTKQDRFKMHQKYCQCTRCSETSQPLWKEVSIAVQPEFLLDPSWPPHFNKALVTNLNTFYWGEDLETPCSMAVSSSSLLQLPSCGEGIQTRKNWLNTSWQVIDTTATSKEVARHRQRRVLSTKYFYQGSCDGQFHLLLNCLTGKRQYHPSP